MRVSSLYLVAVLLVVSLPGALRGNQSSIVVHVIDCAGVSPTAMSVAEHTMVRAFAASGVRVLWREERTLQAGHSALNHVAVIILSREMVRQKSAIDDVPVNALGSAAPPPTRRAWIFLDRIEELAGRQRTSVGSILGVVIAHEVAHAAAGIAHSTNGIMGRELRTGNHHVGGFSEEQGEQIRVALRLAADGDSGATTPVASLSWPPFP